MEESEDVLEFFFLAEGGVGHSDFLLAKIQQHAVLAPELQRIDLNAFELEVDHLNGTALLREIIEPCREISVPLPAFLARLAAAAGRTLEEQDDPELDLDTQTMAGLTPSDVEAIDRAILSCCAERWRKVAYVVAVAMSQFPKSYVGVPDVFYAMRVRALVAEGRIEAQGDLRKMRFSEIRFRPDRQAIGL